MNWIGFRLNTGSTVVHCTRQELGKVRLKAQKSAGRQKRKKRLNTPKYR